MLMSLQHPDNTNVRYLLLGVVEQQQEATACYSSRSREEEIEAGEEGLLLLPPQLHKLSIESCPELSLHPLNSGLHIENEDEDRGGLQALCSLRSLRIIDCPKLLSSYAPSSSSSSPFPSSLQSLSLKGMDLRGVSNPILSSLTELSSLRIDDIAGVLDAPICRVLSSSLTQLVFYQDKEMEDFTDGQNEALQLLTSLEHLEFRGCKKLQSLSAGLRRLTSLKTLEIADCPSIQFLPDHLPNSLQILTINPCSALRSLPNDGLPNSLQELYICGCPFIRALPKDGLPNSLQKLWISTCPSIQALPKGGLPTSLKELSVLSGNSKKLKRQCRNLIGTIPIVKLD